MDDSRVRFAHDSFTLVSASERLQQGAGERACAELLPDALVCIEQSLRALAGGCEAAARSLIPPAGHDKSIAWRYARAAADWPGARDGVGPSYERQAQLLAALHDAGAALRTAAERCATAGDLVKATMEPPSAVDSGHRETAAIAT